MAHFAKIDAHNKVVAVIVVDNENASTEQAGKDFLALIGFDGVWLQTSYNTREGVNTLGGTPFRGNYAGIGFDYDPTLDAFIPPKELPSYVLNEKTFTWVNPIPKPESSETIGWKWNENNLAWESFTK